MLQSIDYQDRCFRGMFVWRQLQEGNLITTRSGWIHVSTKTEHKWSSVMKMASCWSHEAQRVAHRLCRFTSAAFEKQFSNMLVVGVHGSLRCSSCQEPSTEESCGLFLWANGSRQPLWKNWQISFHITNSPSAPEPRRAARPARFLFICKWNCLRKYASPPRGLSRDDEED